MIMPVLLLQRPYHCSNNHDNIAHLTRRLAIWNKGDIDTLVQEGRVLQVNLMSKFSYHKNYPGDLPLHDEWEG